MLRQEAAAYAPHTERCETGFAHDNVCHLPGEDAGFLSCARWPNLSSPSESASQWRSPGTSETAADRDHTFRMATAVDTVRIERGGCYRPAPIPSGCGGAGPIFGCSSDTHRGRVDCSLANTSTCTSLRQLGNRQNRRPATF